MHDMTRDLNKAAGAFPPPAFDLETVRHRRGRREIIRRAGTIATVLVLVTASGSALWSAFHQGSLESGVGTGPPPSNGVIWFTEGEIGGRMEGIQLGSVQPDGTGRAIFTDGMPGGIGGATSPDGSMIVFMHDPERTPDGDYGIWSMRADGSGLTQLTPSEGTDGGPKWSPDGTQILFTRHLGGVPGDPRSGVFAMNADGSEVRALSDDPETDYASADWSPDGNQILLLTYRPGEGNGYVLWVMNQDGSDLREIYRGPCGSPQWSPSGNAILFQTGGTLQLLSIDSADRRTVVDGLDGDVAFRWSPDGTRILYARPISFDEGEELHVVDVEDGNDEIVADGAEWRDPQPAWSPDGTEIAFVRGGDIWTVGIGGSDEQQVTKSPQYEGTPIWAAA